MLRDVGFNVVLFYLGKRVWYRGPSLLVQSFCSIEYLTNTSGGS